MAWHGFEEREAAENKRKAAEKKKRGGSFKSTKPPDQIYKEDWRHIGMESGERTVVGRTKQDKIMSSGGVAIGGSSERGKEGSRSEQPGGNT